MSNQFDEANTNTNPGQSLPANDKANTNPNTNLGPTQLANIQPV